MKAISRKLTAVVLAFLVTTAFMPLIPNTGGTASAATSGTAAAMVSYAKSVAGKSKSSLGISGEWCAAFVYKCATKSGNSSKVGSSAYVQTQAKQTVNSKGGKITFVTKSKYTASKGLFKSARCTYDKDYKPKAGDLYIQYDSSYNFGHVGLVYKNSTKKDKNGRYIAYTLEGNTSCDCGKHSNYKYVEYKVRNDAYLSGGYGICAYVTPKYTTTTSYTLKYDANGGSGAPASVTKASGTTFSLSTVKPTKSGCSFKGWATSSTGAVAYAAGASYTIKASKTLYAVWGPSTWTIKYNANGGSGTMANTTHTYGVKSNLRKNTFTRKGYTFNNWHVYRPNIDKWMYTNGTDIKWYAKGSQPSGFYLNTYNNGGWIIRTTPVDKDTVVLYAKWKANTWTVKYNANGGSGTMANTTHTYGVKSNLRKNTFTRKGYTFNNWHVYRPNIDKWMYTNGTDIKWYAKGSQPSGFYLNTYNDGGWIIRTTPVNNDVVILYAKWK